MRKVAHKTLPERLEEDRGSIEALADGGCDGIDEDLRRRIEAKNGPSDTFDTVGGFVEDAVEQALHDPIPGGGPVLSPYSDE